MDNGADAMDKYLLMRVAECIEDMDHEEAFSILLSNFFTVDEFIEFKKRREMPASPPKKYKPINVEQIVKDVLHILRDKEDNTAKSRR